MNFGTTREGGGDQIPQPRILRDSPGPKAHAHTLPDCVLGVDDVSYGCIAMYKGGFARYTKYA